MTAATSSVIVRPLESTDEPAVRSLIGMALAGGPTGERTAEFFRWKHVDNPFGPSIGLCAEDDGLLVGVRLVMRWAFELEQARISAGRMVDTATHPDYRGRGIFRDLTLASLEIARKDTDVIFNTPNRSSRPGYLTMGWHEVGVMPTSIRPLRLLRLMNGARAALVRADRPAAPAASCPLPSFKEVLRAHEDDVNELLDARRSAVGSRLSTAVDLNYLRWRFARAPGLDYRAVPVMDRGRLRSLGIGRVRHRAGLRELTLSEVFSAPRDGAGARMVLRAARRAGTDHVATHPSRASVGKRDLVRSAYVTSGRVGLTLTTLPLVPLPVDPCTPDAWALSLGDLEVF